VLALRGLARLAALEHDPAGVLRRLTGAKPVGPRDGGSGARSAYGFWIEAFSTSTLYE
jgi:hypothetical protein